MTSQAFASLSEWKDRADQQLSSIARRLRSMESMLEEIESGDVDIFELLERIQTIKKKHEEVTSKFEETKPNFDHIGKDLDCEMKILDQTLELMKIHSGNP